MREFVHPDHFEMRPVRELPVTDLGGRLVGTRVRLRNGTEHWAVLGNVILNSPRQTEQFLTVGIEKDGQRFELARYFDSDYDSRGPEQLAQFLGLPIDEVFPISYDLSAIAVGHPQVLVGRIPQAPREKLTSEELLSLSMEAEPDQ